jgi:DNA-binding NtrC family response regulator
MCDSLLIVDDDPDQLDILSRNFPRNDYQVVAVSHPRRALEVASRQQFQVALLDLSLPEIDGIELMQRLQRTQESLQVIILSGYDYPSSNAKADGAFAVLTKPCSLALLKATVTRALGRQVAVSMS